MPARELFELRYGKALVQTKRRPGSVPVFGTNGPCGTHDEALFVGPGVIIGRKGQGPLGVEWCGQPYWVIDTAYSLTPLSSDVDLKFAYYLIKHIGLNHLKDGTSNPSLSRETFGAQALPLPPLDEQRRIAGILSSLDDKIELNRRMNLTLESIARAIFKSWFVDFGPVRKKMEGGEVGLPSDLAALFPPVLGNSQLGEVPDARSVRQLSDVLTEVSERAGDASVPEYSSTNEGLQPRAERYRKALSASTANNKLVRRGDFVFGLSRKVLNFGLMRDSAGSVSAAYKVFRVRPGSIEPDLLERMMRLSPAYYFNAVSSSSRERQSVSSQSLGHLCFVQPPAQLQEAFHELTAPMSSRSERLGAENVTLEQLRDALLPRLLAGQLSMSASARTQARAF